MEKSIGNFQNKSGEFIISDPGHNVSTGQGLLKNVVKGKWNASVDYMEDDDNDEVQYLIIKHEDIGSFEDEDLTELPFQVLVTNGQLGIFDKEKYEELVANLISLCSEKTNSNKKAGTLPFGAVSISGFGDGLYDGFIHINEDNKIDYIRIIFIDDELFEQDNIDEDYDDYSMDDDYS